jgi:hypothetical protein
LKTSERATELRTTALPRGAKVFEGSCALGELTLPTTLSHCGGIVLARSRSGKNHKSDGKPIVFIEQKNEPPCPAVHRWDKKGNIFEQKERSFTENVYFCNRKDSIYIF